MERGFEMKYRNTDTATGIVFDAARIILGIFFFNFFKFFEI